MFLPIGLTNRHENSGMPTHLAEMFLMVLAMIGCLIPATTSAVMMGLTTEELTRASDSVIDGIVEATEAHWSRDGKSIVTTSTIRVTEAVRGVSREGRSSWSSPGARLTAWG